MRCDGGDQTVVAIAPLIDWGRTEGSPDCALEAHADSPVFLRPVGGFSAGAPGLSGEPESDLGNWERLRTEPRLEASATSALLSHTLARWELRRRLGGAERLKQRPFVHHWVHVALRGDGDGVSPTALFAATASTLARIIILRHCLLLRRPVGLRCSAHKREKNCRESYTLFFRCQAPS